MASEPWYPAKKRERKTEGPDVKYHSGKEDEEPETDGEVNQEKGPRTIKLDPEYARFIGDLTKGAKDEQSKQAIYNLFASEEVRETYGILRKDGLSKREIKDIMSSEGAIRNMVKYKGKITTTDYLEGVVKALRANEHYTEIVEDMHEAEVISERTYHSARQDLHESSSGHKRRAKSALERMVGAWIFLIAGVVLMISSGIAITGGVIGKTATPTLGFIIGFVLFVLGLLMKKK